MPESPSSETAAESRTLVLAVPARLGERVRLRFSDVRHSLRSFEVRVFFGKTDADVSTPVAGERAYAGSFHMYGHGLPSESRTGAEAVIEDGARVSGQRLEAFETVVDVSDARHALAGKTEIEATLVVIGADRGPLPHETFHFGGVRLE